MKKIILLIVFLILFGCKQQNENKNELNIYIYDSLSWIKDSQEIKDFETKNKIKVNFKTFDSTTNMISQLILEKNNLKSDVVIGLNNEMLYRVINENIINKKDSTEFDKGALAFISKSIEIDSFEDIKKLDKKLIIQDPRFSSTGMDFLYWTIAAYGDNWKQYWLDIKDSIYILTPSWSDSFARFEENSDLVMLSYATDGAYSLENYGEVYYKTSIPKEGAFFQEEYIINITKNNIANDFVKMISSEQFQKEIPLNQWMIPANEKVELPESFKKTMPIIENVLTFNKYNETEEILKEWEEIWLKK